MFRKYFLAGIILSAGSTPMLSQAQDDESPGEATLLDEVVVTGSYIKRDKFEMASPVEVIDPADIMTSGYTDIGSYIRDLTYTQNVDTVANVLGVQDGQQDSNSARFNLRGLGTSSTLTLFDGRRVLNQGSVATIIPDIAMERVEIILDGGAATYGTDAIAGVVNMIPLKDYEGFKVRGFYTADEDNDAPESKISMLFGQRFDRIHVTAALDYSERDDALYRSDRPEYLDADNDTSITGNPGTWSVYGGGDPAGGGFRGNDPSCGTFNGDATDDSQAGAYPSGFDLSIYCTLEYGEYQDYKRPNSNLTTYIATTFDVNDSLDLQMLINYNDRDSLLISSTSTGERGSNNLLLAPDSHPNNPFAFAGNVSPRNWRPFNAKNGATIPSHIDSNGATNSTFNYETAMLSLGAEFELGGGWSGSSWVTRAQSSTNISGHALNNDRLWLALQGMGGPNGNQWFNPFGSASRLSPDYVDCETGTGAGCSANDQGLVDWLYQKESYESLKTDAWNWEGVVTGDIYDLPAGSVAMAVGAQYRYYEYKTGSSPLSSTPSQFFTDVSAVGGPASQNYGRAPTNGVAEPTSGDRTVAALFTEFDIPILSNLNMIIAARHESFRDEDMQATVPKLSFRYEPFADLSLRTSYGEGFLAPTVSELRFDPDPGCAEAFTGNDPFLGTDLTGALTCSNGNPDLEPEISEVFNIGATWRATDDLELSLDYQTIDYQDRIIRLSSSDTIAYDKANFLESAGMTEAEFDALPDAQKNALAVPWFTGPGNQSITRDLDPGSPSYLNVMRIETQPQNISEVEVGVLDFRVRYGTDIGAFGYVAANLSTTYYTSYEVVDPFGDTIDVNGQQNGDTNLAPPLPRYKSTLRLNWLLDNHNVAMTYKHSSAVEFDSTPGPAFGPEEYDPNSVPDEIDQYGTIDLRYSYEFQDVFGGNFDLGIGANNITDNRAQPLPIAGGLETRLQDPIGRTYYLEGTLTLE